MTAAPVYKPGRFQYLMTEPFAAQLWSLITDETSIAAMIEATSAGKPAIAPLLAVIEERFAGPFSSPRFPPEEITVLANNMIKQVMESRGYEHVACGLCPGARFFRSSGVYRPCG